VIEKVSPMSSSLTDLIEMLQTAERSSRALDGRIALAVGPQREETDETDADDDRDTESPGKLPRYTSSVDAAASFAKSMTTTSEYALSWTPAGRAIAVIGNKIGIARTPAMALCIAALKTRVLDAVSAT
jgi:hypothetical protein